MIRRLLIVAVASVALAGCGHVSASTATKNWVTDSALYSALHSLGTDAQHVHLVLTSNSYAPGVVKSVCAVMLLETQQANASLPSPDAQLTSLLSGAYTQLGAAANLCYHAAGQASRQRALRFLSRGLAQLSESRARAQAAS